MTPGCSNTQSDTKGHPSARSQKWPAASTPLSTAFQGHSAISFRFYHRPSSIPVALPAPDAGQRRARLLIAEMKGCAAVHMRSEQMSTAFIRKTQNYPLLHTVFHLLQGKQRLLIRKAALSTISLAGDGVGGQMPTSPSESWHGLTLRGGWAIGNTGSTALRRRMLTNWAERRSVQASLHHCIERALPTDSHPQSWLQWPAKPPLCASHTLSLQHTQEAEVWDRKRQGAGGPTDPAISSCFHSLSLSSPALLAIENSTSDS